MTKAYIPADVGPNWWRNIPGYGGKYRVIRSYLIAATIKSRIRLHWTDLHTNSKGRKNMERNIEKHLIEKDLIEIECAIKDHEKRGNTFTVSVLQRCYELVSQLKKYQGIGTVGEIEVAYKRLRVLDKYEKLGTLDECRSAMEKQKAKAPNVWGDGCDDHENLIYDMYDCPKCGKSYEIDYDDYKYCPECGQAMDRSDLGK